MLLVFYNSILLHVYSKGDKRKWTFLFLYKMLYLYCIQNKFNKIKSNQDQDTLTVLIRPNRPFFAGYLTKNILPLYCWDTAGGGVVPRGGVGGGWGAPRGGGSGGGAPESPFWLAGEYFLLTIWWLLTTEVLFSWPPIPLEWVWWAGTRGGGSKWCERGGSAGGAPPLLIDSAPIFASERRRSSSAISARPPVWCKALLLRSCNTKN